jgi:hypothetical protein
MDATLPTKEPVYKPPKMLLSLNTESRQYICESCPNIYKDRSGLWRHVKKCHNGNKTTATATEEKNAETNITLYDLKNGKTQTQSKNANAINRKMPEQGVSEALATQSVGVRGFACEAGVSGWRPETPTGLPEDGLPSKDNVDGDINMNMLNMIYDLVKQNQEIKEMLLKQHEMIIDQTKRQPSIIQQQIIHNHTTNNHAHLNINLFLQEKCNNAMNMNEFVDNLTVQMCDLEMVGRLGFVEGISRIIINGLRRLDIYTRPIHCTDTKRDTIYIRDRDEWKRDTDDKEHTKRAIARVANKNLNKIPEWKRLHPETEIFESAAYNMNMQIMVQSLGGIGGTSAEKTTRNQEKIWKRIMPEVVVDKKGVGELRSPLTPLLINY